MRSSSFWAASMRCVISRRIGVVPVVAWKWRAKVRAGRPAAPGLVAVGPQGWKLSAEGVARATALTLHGGGFAGVVCCEELVTVVKE
ncbi:hypothetical protein ACWD04_19655 [Streptomyces sp. NPDC002911]